MRKIILLITFLGYTAFFAGAQSKGKKKEWQIVVIGKEFRAKAILRHVTDSSVILLFRKDQTGEISFSTIEKIKLRRLDNELGKRLLGFLAGGIAGGTSAMPACGQGPAAKPDLRHS